MKSLFRVIRYSSVGIFLAGIFTTLVGCSNEDQLRALLLFLLLLFAGGGSEEEMATTSPLAGTNFADFTTATPATLGPSNCTSAGGGAGGAGSIVPELLPNLDMRTLGFGGNPTGGPGTFTILVDNNKLTISTTDTCIPASSYLTFDNSSNFNNVDFSAFSQVNIRVTSLTGGPVTGCEIRVTDNIGGPGVTSAPFDLSVGDTSVSIAGGINMNVMHRISFGSCDFNGATTMVIEAFHIE